jgi:tRNA modification GTPase
MTHTNDTIAAISTAHGVSAIGVIRISGLEAIAILGKMFRPFGKNAITDYRPGQFVHGRALSSDGRVLDDCCAVYSLAPYSYTGENSAEIQCHGSPVALAAVLRSCFFHGARQAERGEFTKRAFLNGKLDLIEAEAVAELIDAETEEQVTNAARQLLGAASRRIIGVYDRLVDVLSHFFAVIDYPDEDIEDFAAKGYLALLEAARTELNNIGSSFTRGKILKNGVPAAIIGKPNVGKSSLLNALAGFERAIVTDIPGTTRDTVEEKIVVGGTLLRLTDTAGLRKTNDAIEKIGVERARLALEDAALVICVFDGSRPLDAEDRDILARLPEDKTRVAVVNKSDLPQQIELAELKAHFPRLCTVSAATGAGLNALTAELKSAADELSDRAGSFAAGEIITSERQHEAISRAEKALADVTAKIKAGVSADACLFELESAAAYLGEAIGKNVTDDTVETIFARFCVGK